MTGFAPRIHDLEMQVTELNERLQEQQAAIQELRQTSYDHAYDIGRMWKDLHDVRVKLWSVISESRCSRRRVQQESTEHVDEKSQTTDLHTMS